MADSHINSNLSTVSTWLLTNRSEILSAVNTNLTKMANVTLFAQSLWPDSANGATVTAPNATGMTSGPMTWIGLDFPAVTKSGGVNATGNFVLPGNYNAGTFTVTFYWTTPGSEDTGTVVWDARLLCKQDAGAMNAGWGTNQSVSDTGQGASLVHVSSATGAITAAGTPTAGAMCWIQTRRLGGTVAGSASLLAERIAFGIQ